MATIKSQMTLNDGMSAVLKKITKALDITLASFEQVQQASGNAVNVATIEAARGALVDAGNAADEMAENYRRAAQEEEKLNQGINRGASAMDGLLGKVKSMAVSMGAAAGVRQLIGLSDQMTGTAARLELIVDDGGTVEALEAKIMASAQRSRAAYLDTASAIAGMGANASNAFSGNDELIAFMEQVNKQFVIGGASAQGQSAAMLQLTQAMAAGALRGEELNSILENAPGIARAIEQYMGAAEGSIKSYAEQGLITSEVVKDALFSVAEETNAKFEGMPQTWGQMWIGMQNKALTILDPILEKINRLANSPQAEAAINGLLGGLQMVAAIGGAALDVLGSGAAFVVDNWGWISPIVYGVATALGVYYGAQLAANTVGMVSNGIHVAMAAAQMLHAAATGGLTAATAADIAAQNGLNAALYACPIVWIVMLVIALIAAFYAAVAAVNHFAGTSYSATGLIAGAFATLGAHVINTFIVPFQNKLASIANFVGNVFNNPVAAVKVLFYDMALTVIGYITNMAHAIEDVINKIPGMTVDITSGLDNFYSGLEQAQQAVKDESGWIEYVAKMDYIDYGDAASAGYEFGQGVEDKIGGFFNGFGSEPGAIEGFDGFMMDDLGNDVGAIANNTGGMADALEVSGEELKYLRDIAERDAVNRFTTAEVKIDMTGMTNKIDGGADLDGVIRELTDGFSEALVTAAEGVHE